MTQTVDVDVPYVMRHSSEGVPAPFIVCAFFTENFRKEAARLAASLEGLSLPFALFEMPQIHHSISASGSADLQFSKPRFIAWALKRFGKPVVYVDADCVFCRSPELFFLLPAQRVDFAIYNWLADLMNDAWAPDPNRREKNAQGQPRYWRFGFAIDKASDTQLLCSGGVQYWADSDAARGLLNDWEQQLAASPRTPDDECLDLTFNFPRDPSRRIERFWLPKEYIRCAHWLYILPVINHPKIPAPQASGQFNSLGDARVDVKHLVDVSKARPFPRGCIIDAMDGRLLMADSSGATIDLPLSMPLYL